MQVSLNENIAAGKLRTRCGAVYKSTNQSLSKVGFKVHNAFLSSEYGREK
jgi:hypothetical protein